MISELSNLELIHIAIDIFLFISVMWCLLHLKGHCRMVQVMTADSDKVDTDPALIEEWFVKYQSYDKNTPKWLAYRKRLKQEGRI